MTKQENSEDWTLLSRALLPYFLGLWLSLSWLLSSYSLQLSRYLHIAIWFYLIVMGSN